MMEGGMEHSHRLGVDIVEVERIRGIMERYPEFARRVFTPGEMGYCDRFPDPARHYAARFAAKEAAFKALDGRSRALRFLDYEVKMDGGRPYLSICGGTEVELRGLEIGDISLSLAHERQCAVATVLISCGDGGS